MLKKILIGLVSMSAFAVMLVVLAQNNSPAITTNAKLNFDFTYQLKMDSIPENAGTVDIWIPLPSSNGVQEITDYKINSELAYNLYLDPEYGNRIVHLASNGHIPKNLNVEIILNVIRLEQDGRSHSGTSVTGNSSEKLDRYLQPDILVPIDGPIEAEARLAVKDAATPEQKAQALYRHLFETMKYDKSGVGWGKGDALYACEVRQGNCTDIHSLFIGMARSLKIPSRFIMGFPLPENKNQAPIPGYHCWAEFYIDGQGWVPVDISEAIKHPEKKEYFFGRLDPHRVAFTTGRDIKVNSGDISHTLNYFIYPYVLVDGQPFTGARYNFSFAQKN